MFLRWTDRSKVTSSDKLVGMAERYYKNVGPYAGLLIMRILIKRAAACGIDLPPFPSRKLARVVTDKSLRRVLLFSLLMAARINTAHPKKRWCLQSCRSNLLGIQKCSPSF